MAGRHLGTAAHDGGEPPEWALVRSVLAGQWNQAMFVSELVARVTNERRGAGAPERERLTGRVEVALSALEARGEVLVSQVPAADPCFKGDDLRVAALVGGGAAPGLDVAHERIAAVAEQLAREVLATHTCG